MSSYREQLARREALAASQPKREYITNAEYAKLKAALTRAKNSGDPEKILRAVEKAIAVFDQKIWPDNWPMWRIALEDASWDARRKAQQCYDNYEEEDRLIALSEELHAASLVLFR